MQHLIFYRILLAGFIFLMTGCGEPSVVSSEQRPPELIVFDEATNVQTMAEPDGKYILTYRLNVRYPAQSVVERISAIFGGARWQPLTRDWLNPEDPSGHARGWSTFTDGSKTPNTNVHVWSAEWKDSTGNLCIYRLHYDSAFSLESFGPDNSDLKVMALFIPATVVAATRKQAGVESPLK
jgi:hypothetical protein